MPRTITQEKRHSIQPLCPRTAWKTYMSPRTSPRIASRQPAAQEQSPTHSAGRAATDLLNTARSSVLAWWLPLGAMILAIPLPDLLKTLIWVLALAWMGGACVLNSRRCGRVHCRYTGPFLLLMILPVLGHGLGIVPLGEAGWLWLGLVAGGGMALIWWGSERILGRYR